MDTLTIILAIVGLAAGVAVGYVYRKKLVEEKTRI